MTTISTTNANRASYAHWNKGSFMPLFAIILGIPSLNILALKCCLFKKVCDVHCKAGGGRGGRQKQSIRAKRTTANRFLSIICPFSDNHCVVFRQVYTVYTKPHTFSPSLSFVLDGLLMRGAKCAPDVPNWCGGKQVKIQTQRGRRSRNKRKILLNG